MINISFTVPTFHIQSLRQHCVTVKPERVQAILDADLTTVSLIPTGAYLEVTYMHVDPETNWGSVRSTHWEAFTVTCECGATFALYAENEEHVKLQLGQLQEGITEEVLHEAKDLLEQFNSDNLQEDLEVPKEY